MTNKTKQLIITALMCSINPIIATPIEIEEAMNQGESITTQLDETYQALEAARNQEDKNHLRHLFIEQLKQYEAIITNIANQYEVAGLEGKSPKYKAYALLAVAEIAKQKSILADVKTETELIALWEGTSKKYEQAAYALRLAAAKAASDKAKEKDLYKKAGEAYNLAAKEAPNQANKKRLYQEQGKALCLAACATTDKAEKEQLYEQVRFALQLAEYVVNCAEKHQLYEQGGLAFGCAADDNT